MRTQLGLWGLLFTAFAGVLAAKSDARADDKGVTKFVRFQMEKTTAYGIVEGDNVRQLKGNLFGKWEKTDQSYPLSSVKLLAPGRPSQVLAMAGNYHSHLVGTPVPEKFRIPQ